MAIHPDDPPFSAFSVPRFVSNYEELEIFVGVLSITK
jgi:D-mannonate dehydratase